MPSLLLRASGNSDAGTGTIGNPQLSMVDKTSIECTGVKGSRIGGDLHRQNLGQEQRTSSAASCERTIDSPSTLESPQQHSDAVTGYGMGPEWIAKSNMQSFLKQKDQQQASANKAGNLKVGTLFPSECKHVLTTLFCAN